MEKRDISIRQTAKKLGLSAMTVYRVINNTGMVKSKTRERVIEELNAGGYFRLSVPKKRKVIFDFGINWYLDKLGIELMRRLSGHGIECVPVASRKAMSEFLDMAAGSDIAVFLSVPDERIIEETRKANPNIYIISIPTLCSADLVISSDGMQGGELAARHLIDYGHVRHLAVHLAEEQSDRMIRYKAFYAEIKTIAPECVIDTFFQKLGEPCEKSILRYLEQVNELPSAIFFLIGSYAQIFQFKILPLDPVRYGKIGIVAYDRNEDIKLCDDLVKEFDRIEFAPEDMIDIAEYYILNRPLLKHKMHCRTYVESRLVIKGSVENIKKNESMKSEHANELGKRQEGRNMS